MVYEIVAGRGLLFEMFKMGEGSPWHTVAVPEIVALGVGRTVMVADPLPKVAQFGNPGYSIIESV